MAATIRRISVFTLCNDLGGKVWNPAIRWNRKHVVFVSIKACDGVQGLGECWYFDREPDALVAFLRTEVVPHFIGQNIQDAAAIAERMAGRATLTARHSILTSALWGVDIACWGLRAQQAGSPLRNNISPAGNGLVPMYASGGLYGEGKTQQPLADEMAGHAQNGFQLSKMKVGGQNIPEDVARVHRVLDVLPANAAIGTGEWGNQYVEVYIFLAMI